MVETDGCHSGIGAVLMQNGRPLAYFSKVLALRHMDKSIYENEYIAIFNAIDKWRHYFQYRHFVVRTDHHSLKYLLNRRLTQLCNKKGLTKLLGINYEVQYKKRVENRVADALSRQFESLPTEAHHQATRLAINMNVPVWVQEISTSY